MQNLLGEPEREFCCESAQLLVEVMRWLPHLAKHLCVPYEHRTRLSCP